VLPKDAMTASEVSRYLSMDEDTIRRMAADRSIPALLHEGQWLFSRKSIDKWRLRRAAAAGRAHGAGAG
jgi:excisionase family DNA binding protein